MLKTSVGQGGGNAAVEVKIVQILLNQWLGDRGGTLLKIDGLIGPRTIGAIQGFQAEAGTGSDGRVDPSGPTLKALIAYQTAQATEALASTYNGRQLLEIAGKRVKTPGEGAEAFIAALRATLSKPAGALQAGKGTGG